VYAVASVVAVLTIAHFAWKYSGSNQWELWQNKNGVAVYKLKVPGATRLQYKVVSRIHANLNSIAGAWTDTTTEGCRNFIRTCTVGRIYKPFDEQTLNYTQAYRVAMPQLFPGMPQFLRKPMAMALKMQLSRDPRTKTIQMDVTSLPELLPADSCCLSMGEAHNVWRITPLGNGMVEFEFRENDDPPIPYWLYNRFMLRNKPLMSRNAERAFNLEKYRHAEFAFLNESPAQTASAARAEAPAAH
jgi:hypothetical protein